MSLRLWLGIGFDMKMLDSSSSEEIERLTRDIGVRMRNLVRKIESDRDQEKSK